MVADVGILDTFKRKRGWRPIDICQWLKPILLNRNQSSRSGRVSGDSGRRTELNIAKKGCCTMSGDYFNISGTDPSKQPNEIFVWCRAEGRADYALVETGHAVGTADERPPGIEVGQFSVTFRLPADCAVDSLIVTSDKNAEQLLPEVTVTRCS